MLVIKIFIRVNKVLKNKETSKNKLIIVLNKVLNISLISLISLISFSIQYYLYFLNSKINIFLFCLYATLKYNIIILLFCYLVSFITLYIL